MDFGKKISIAGAYLGDPGCVGGDFFQDPGVISHKGINAAEVPTGADGAGIVVGKVVEEFRG